MIPADGSDLNFSAPIRRYSVYAWGLFKYSERVFILKGLLWEIVCGMPNPLLTSRNSPFRSPRSAWNNSKLPVLLLFNCRISSGLISFLKPELLTIITSPIFIPWEYTLTADARSIIKYKFACNDFFILRLTF